MQARSLALQLIGILLLPVLVVAGVTILAAGPRPYFIATVLLGMAGFAVIFTTRDARVRVGQPDYEQALLSYTSNVARAAAIGIATLAVLFAASSPRITLAACSFAILWTLLWLPAGMRTIGIKTSIVIGRDQTTVFDFVADERNAPQFVPGLTSVDKITDGPIGVGTQFRVTTANFVGVDQVTSFQPPTATSSSLVSGLRPNRQVLAFEAVPEGTRLAHSFDSELSYPSALAGQGLLRPLMAAQMRARRYAAWERLKQILETGRGV